MRSPRRWASSSAPCAPGCIGPARAQGQGGALPHMTCAENREQHSALLDGELPAVARARVEAHLAGCAECSAELARLTRMLGMLHTLPAERAPVGFVDRVLAAARPRRGTCGPGARARSRGVSSCRWRPRRWSSWRGGGVRIPEDAGAAAGRPLRGAGALLHARPPPTPSAPAPSLTTTPAPVPTKPAPAAPQCRTSGGARRKPYRRRLRSPTARSPRHRPRGGPSECGPSRDASRVESKIESSERQSAAPAPRPKRRKAERQCGEASGEGIRRQGQAGHPRVRKLRSEEERWRADGHAGDAGRCRDGSDWGAERPRLRAPSSHPMPPGASP
jgi:anti-sigma factor RsiW